MKALLLIASVLALGNAFMIEKHMSPSLPRHGEENAKAEDKQDIIHYIGNVNTAVGNSRHPLFPPPRPGYDDITPETPTFREPNRARAFGEIVKAWLNHHGDSSRHMDTMPGHYGEDKKPFGYTRHHHDIGDDADTMLEGDTKPFGYRRHHYDIGDDADTMLGGDKKPFGYRRHHYDIGDDADMMLGGDKKPFGYRRHHYDIGDDADTMLGGDKKPFGYRRHHYDISDDADTMLGGDKKPFGYRRHHYDIGDDADTMLGGDKKPFGYRRHHYDIGDDADTMLGGDKKPFGYRRRHHDIGDDVEHRRNHNGDILGVLGRHKTLFEWGRHNFGHSPQRRINEMDDPAGGFGEDEKPSGSKLGSYGKYWDDTADNKEGFQDALGDKAEDKEYEEEEPDTADMEMAAMGM